MILIFTTVPTPPPAISNITNTGSPAVVPGDESGRVPLKENWVVKVV